MLKKIVTITLLTLSLAACQTNGSYGTHTMRGPMGHAGSTNGGGGTGGNPNFKLDTSPTTKNWDMHRGGDNKTSGNRGSNTSSSGSGSNNNSSGGNTSGGSAGNTSGGGFSMDRG